MMMLQLKNTAVLCMALSMAGTAAWGASARSGDGTMTVTPVTTTVGSTGNSFTYSFRNQNHGDFRTGSRLALTIPAGWTAPQAAAAGSPGFVSVVSTAGTATASILSVTGAGPWTVTVNMTVKKGAANGFSLGYAGGGAGVTAPAATGSCVFVTQTRRDGGTYAAIAASPAVAVAKGNQAIVFPPVGDQVATSQVTLAAAASSGLPVTFTVGSGPAAISGGTSLVFQGAGTVWVVASQEGDANWNPAPAVSNRMVVSKAWAEVALGDLSQVYDGTPRMVAAATVPEGLAVDLTYDGSPTAPVAAGAYAVDATVNNAMYQGQQSGTLVVAKAPAGLTLENLVQTCNDGPRPVTAVTEPAELAVEITYDGSPTPPTDAGSYAVAATIQEANYEGSATGTLVLAPACAHLRLRNLVQVYDGDPKPVEPETTPDGLAVEITYDGEETPPVDAGVYAVEAVVVEDNYTGFVTETQVVAKAQIPVTLHNLQQTYDGEAKSVAATTDPEVLLIEITYDGAPEAPVAAGSYAVAATVVDPNYEGSATGTLVVARAGQTIDFPEIDDQRTPHRVALQAAASSGLEVAFRVAGGPAVLQGLELSFTGTGVVSVAAAQVGDDNWEPAPEVVRSFNVLPLPLVVETSRTRVNVREAGEGRFFVRLGQAPETNVVLSVSRSAGDTNLTVKAGALRSFTPANWSAWQVVTLAAGADGNAADETATFRISAPGQADWFVEAATLDDDLAENVALASGGAVISGTTANQAALLIDGVHTSSANYGYTIWTSSPPGTLTLALRAPTAVSRLRLLNWDWNHRVHRYTIESSLDGAAWTLLADARAEDHQGWDDWVVNDQMVRYLRFTGLSNSANSFVALAEWEVYGRVLPAPVISKAQVNVREAGEGRFFVRLAAAPTGTVVVSIARDSGSTNLTVKSGAARVFKPADWNNWQVVVLTASGDDNAAGETAVFRISTPGMPEQFVQAVSLDDDIGENLARASSGSTISGSQANQMTQLIDGVHTSSANYGWTVWTNTPPGTMTLDLQAPSTVSRVRLLSWDWSCRTHRYKIESSVDAIQWSLLADASREDRQGWDDWSVSNATIRYLRFTGLSNSADRIEALVEWEVYGTRVPLPPAVVSKPAVNVREAGEGRFFVRLAGVPAGSVAVTVNFSSGDTNITVKSGAVRAFTAGNWNSWQSVTLAASNDVNADSESAVFRVSSPGAPDQYVTATVLDDDIGVNQALAVNGSQAWGTSAGVQSRMIDGVHTASTNYGHTDWTAVPQGTTTLDLGAATAVTRIRLLNWDWSCIFQGYRIESSLDGGSWTPLLDAGGEGRQGWDDWAVDGRSMRYLRLTGLSNSVSTCVIISELEVYGTRTAGRRSLAPAKAPAAAAPAAGVQTESGPVAVLTSDGPEDETGWAAVDGDPETAWAGQKAGGGYLVVEYAPALHLGVLEVDLAEDSLADIGYLYSLDGQDWQPLPDDMENHPVEARFLWLVFPDDGTGARPQVVEIRPNP